MGKDWSHCPAQRFAIWVPIVPLNPKPEALNPKPQTLNPKPYRVEAVGLGSDILRTRMHHRSAMRIFAQPSAHTWLSRKCRGLSNYLYYLQGFLVMIIVEWAPKPNSNVYLRPLY